MGKIKIELAKVVGTSSSTSWSQVHTFFPPDSLKLEKRGKLLAVISLKTTEPGVETIALGREILARLHEEYFGNLEGGILERLKESLKKIKAEWPETEITAGVIFSKKELNILYVGILGKGKVILKRDGTLNELLGGEEKEVVAGSGLVEAGDVLLFGSQIFFETVSEGVLRACLGTGSPQEMVESLAPIILARGELGQAAAVICSLEEEKTEEFSVFSPQPEETKEKEEEKIIDKKGLKDSLLTCLRSFLSKIKIKERPFYVRKEIERKSNKAVILVAIILVFLFLISLILGISKKKGMEKEAKFKALISQGETKYNEAKEIIELDVRSAKVLLQEAETLLAEAKKIKPKDNEEIDFLKNEVQKLLLKTKKDIELGEIPIFFDLSLISKEAKTTDVSYFKNKLTVLDSPRSSVYTLDLEKKSTEILEEKKLKEGKKVVFCEQQVYVLTEEGIIQANLRDKKFSLIIPKSEKWGKILSLGCFAGNLYLLDGEKKMIWQYPRLEVGFGELRAWSSEDAFKDEPYSMAIDGSIWVLLKGKILKFIRGLEEKFEIKGCNEGIGEAKLLFTDDSTQYIYLVDTFKKKVMVFTKDGQFKAQYLWSGKPEEPEFFFAAESSKRAFLGKENLIYAFSLEEILK